MQQINQDEKVGLNKEDIKEEDYQTGVQEGQDQVKDVILQDQDENSKYYYDEDQYPPNLDLVEKHLKANKVGIVTNFDDFCLCCGKPVNKTEVDLSIDRASLGFLGPLFPLYFDYILYAVLICILLFLVNIYSLVYNLQGPTCNYIINCNNVTKTSLFNQQDMNVQSISNLTNVIVILIFLQIYQAKMRKSTIKFDQESNSPADYTIMLSNLPPGQFNVEDVKNLFSEFFQSSEVHKAFQTKYDQAIIKKVNLTYNINQFSEVLGEIEKAQNQKMEMLREKDQESDKDKIETMNNEFAELEEKLVNLEKSLKEMESEIRKGNVDQTTGVVFVQFDRQEVVQYILSFQQTSFMKGVFIWICSKIMSESAFKKAFPQQMTFKDRQLRLERAPEPSDINWSNMGIDKSTILKLKILTHLATFILLAVCFGMILGVNLGQLELSAQQQQKDSSDVNFQVKIFFISTIGSVFVVLINFVLVELINSMTAKQKLPTITHVCLAIAQRLSISLLVNTALVLLIVQMYIGKSAQKQTDIQAIMQLIENTFTLFFSNALVNPIVDAINPSEIPRYLKRRKVKNIEDNKLITQKEAQLAFNGEDLLMEVKYSSVIKTLCFTAFFSSLNPLFILISILGLILKYWSDKYFILRRAQEPILLSDELNTFLTSFLQFVPICISLGGLTFKKFIQPKSNLTLDFITLGISCLHLVIPSLTLNQLLFTIDENTANSTPYDKARIGFSCDYDRTNPLTQKIANEEWIEFQVENGLIEKENAASMKEQQAQSNILGNLQQVQGRNRVNFQQQQINRQNLMQYQMNFFNQSQQYSQMIPQQVRQIYNNMPMMMNNMMRMPLQQPMMNMMRQPMMMMNRQPMMMIRQNNPLPFNMIRQPMQMMNSVFKQQLPMTNFMPQIKPNQLLPQQLQPQIINQNQRQIPPQLIQMNQQFQNIIRPNPLLQQQSQQQQQQQLLLQQQQQQQQQQKFSYNNQVVPQQNLNNQGMYPQNPQMNLQQNPQVNQGMYPQMNQQSNPQINQGMYPQMNQQLNPQINQNPQLRQGMYPQMNFGMNPLINQNIMMMQNQQMRPQQMNIVQSNQQNNLMK